MGRRSKSKNVLEFGKFLFDAASIPTIEAAPESDFLSIRYPLWTENKAKLIQEYIKLFTYVTKHGAYIDGFAAPQRRDRLDLCSAKLVLEAEPKRVREFWLCDIDPHGIELLNHIRLSHDEKGRQIHIIQGDFNSTVSSILSSGHISEKTATFALLDQRTFECSWSTVEQLARHKKNRKIEIFYFLASGWIDRSIAAVKKPETIAKARQWWGRDDWQKLKGLGSIDRAKLLADRFKSELGYAYAYPYAIHDRLRRGRTMYHMVHATDHPDAPPLMIRAYKKISGRTDAKMPIEQIDLDTLW